MSDQIILEFIGDPSGLKPAEDALKGLSKTSQETIEAFGKANTAAIKFAESAHGIATSLKGVDDAAGKSVKAISSLTQAISGGAVKTIIADFKNWASEIVSLTTKKEKLQGKLTAVETEMAKLKGELKEASKEYNSLGKEAGTLETQITKTGNAIAFHASAAEKAATKNQSLQTKLADVKKELAAMNGTSEEGSTKYQKLTTGAQNLEKQIAKNNTSYASHSAKVLELGAKNEALKGKLSGVKTEMGTLSTKMTEGKGHFSSLSKEAKTLQSGITATNKAITKSSKEFSHHSKAAKESTQSISSLIGNTKKLVSAMGEIGAAMAHASGNEKEANDIRQKTAEVLNIISTAQSIATTATEAMTAATEIATVAATGLDVALAPVTLVILAVAAAAAQLYAEFKLFQYIVNTVKPIGDALKYVEDKARDFLSFLTSGLVDNAAVHQHKEEVKKIGEEHENNSEILKKQIGLLEAEGASAGKLAAKKKEQLQEEKASLEAQLELETDVEKHKEIQNKLDENAIALIKNKKEIADAHLEVMRQQGATELQILQEQKRQNDEAVEANANAIQKLKTDIQDAAAHGAITGKMFEQLAALEEQGEVLAEQHKTLSASIAAEQQKAWKEASEKKKELNEKELQDAKTRVETQLLLVKKGSQEEYDLKMELLNKERDLVNANEQLSAADKQKAFTEISLKEDELWSEQLKKLKDAENQALKDKEAQLQQQIEAQKDADKQELQSKIDSIDAQLAKEKKYSAAAVQLRKDKLADQMQLQIDEATSTITDQKALTARLEEIKKQYIKDCNQLDEEARKDNDKKDAEATKKKEEQAKQIGKALIDIAKQVSDAIFENEKQKRDNDLKEHLDTLNAQKDAELLNTTLTASQRQAIEKKYKNEEAQEKQKAWKADQKAKAEQAIINGLLAFAAALAQNPTTGYIQGAIALATAGVQAGIILSKTPPKFAKGVVALDGPGTPTSDSIHAMLSRGESVITADATERYKPMLEAMNAGTFMERYMPLPQMPDVSRQLASAMSPAVRNEKIDYEKIGEALARKINMKQLNVNIDEKGFTKAILSKGNRIEYHNDKMKF